MAIVKYIVVHLSPLKCIRYILNGGKTDKMRFVTGLKCTPNAKASYMGMAANFENFSDERFYKKSLNSKNSDDEKIYIKKSLEN